MPDAVAIVPPFGLVHEPQLRTASDQHVYQEQAVCAPNTRRRPPVNHNQRWQDVPEQNRQTEPDHLCRSDTPTTQHTGVLQLIKNQPGNP